MTLNEKIEELLEVNIDEHDIEWLKSSLQVAVKLEFFIIPPYLAAMWSIKDRAHFAARSIRVIIREEMLHMGLVCNMLSALGEVAQINHGQHLPTYPKELPGHLHSGLLVSLQGLSNESLETFMAIELPENGSVVEPKSEMLKALNEKPSTIGAFYSAIKIAFESLKPNLSPVNQQEDLSLGLFKVTDDASFSKAITLIKRQGEGSDNSPEDTSPSDLAHYYRFGEIKNKKKLRKDPVTGKWNFNGEDVLFPDVLPMSKVPSGGYRNEDVNEQVRVLLNDFDQNYTEMVNLLQSAWQGGSLDNAIYAMYTLASSARSLIATEIPNGNGNYGPCFRLI